MTDRNVNTVTVATTVDRSVTFSDGDVLAGRTPRGKNASRVRVGGEWLYFSGKATGKSDEGYAKGLLAGKYSRSFGL